MYIVKIRKKNLTCKIGHFDTTREFITKTMRAHTLEMGINQLFMTFNHFSPAEQSNCSANRLYCDETMYALRPEAIVLQTV